MKARATAHLVLMLLAAMPVCATPAARAQAAPPSAASGCTVFDAEASDAVAVGPVIDVRAFKTADGREIRLAGIAPLASAGDEAGDDARARTALSRALGAEVVLVPAGTADRYGRLPAHALRPNAGDVEWVALTLVREGYAVASEETATPACFHVLLNAEREAREAGRGLWADPNFAIRKADDGPSLTALTGRYVVTEGKVMSVREAGGTVYMNFGRVWRRSLTVTVAKRTATAFKAAGLDLAHLEGRQVRVRGWLDRRVGPTIEASRPAQIEPVE